MITFCDCEVGIPSEVYPVNFHAARGYFALNRSEADFYQVEFHAFALFLNFKMAGRQRPATSSNRISRFPDRFLIRFGVRGTG